MSYQTLPPETIAIGAQALLDFDGEWDYDSLEANDDPRGWPRRDVVAREVIAALRDAGWLRTLAERAELTP